MLSFISIFKTSRNRQLAKTWGLWFLWMFLLLAGGQWLASCLPQEVGQEPLPFNYRNWDTFSLFEAEGPFDVTEALYYDIGPMIARARQADVLILGNSRPLFAFREDAVQKAEKENGLTFFGLSGPGDNAAFSEDILLRNDLHPKFLIVNEDDFFNPKLWPFQKEAMSGSWWHSWSKIYSNYGRWVLNYCVRSLIPRFLFFKPNQGKENKEFLSPENGFLFSENMSGLHYPIRIKPKPRLLDPLYLSRAKDFVNVMRKRGTEVILTFVPYGENPAVVKEEARRLGVGCVLPTVNGLETFDGMHLTPESAEKFSDSFFEVFFKLPEIRKLRNSRK